ncbi:SDR family oxidoreductase [Brevibacterium atlanticum]|uniref:SDR family oxidoreductase n=1 Tax=Brevibacterium atlanticum TaxID=2697563 RepID=UPI001421B7B3|nr:SDR family oxidoreductase [Brevibacterium atlanticum]
MHVFITGGTGLIGSAVTKELISNGHSASILARSDASAERAAELGAAAVRGDLSSADVLRSAAEAADGVIHLAFRNDFSSPAALAASVEEEASAIDTLGRILIGSDKPFVMVAGTPAVTGRTATEADPLPTDGPVGGRSVAVTRALRFGDQGVRTSAIRLPRTVHADGEGGFAGLLANFAEESGICGYPGDGTQRWPAVHAQDAAALFRLALESAEGGTSWHAVADEGVRVIDIAEVLGRRLGLPVGTVPEENFGPLGPIFATDQPASSQHTRSALGWTPTRPGLLDDLESLTR